MALELLLLFLITKRRFIWFNFIVNLQQFLKSFVFWDYSAVASFALQQKKRKSLNKRSAVEQDNHTLCLYVLVQSWFPRTCHNLDVVEAWLFTSTLKLPFSIIQSFLLNSY